MCTNLILHVSALSLCLLVTQLIGYSKINKVTVKDPTVGFGQDTDLCVIVGLNALSPTVFKGLW